MTAQEQKEQEEQEYAKTLYNSYSTSLQQFEKLTIFIASGAFSLSFTFIKEIVELKTAQDKWLLYFAWGGYLAVIFISLAGHYISTLIHSLAIKHCKLDPEDFNKKMMPYNIVIHVLNALIILGLALASLWLIQFIQTNI